MSPARSSMYDFARTKKLFKSSIARILEEQGTDDILSEAAFPAYANRNPFIDRMFWQRVGTVYNYIREKQAARKDTAELLDFGCGSGVLSYALSTGNFRITALDLTLKPVNVLKKYISFPSGINFEEGSIGALGKYRDETFDFAAALDVFEHIADIGPYVEAFRRIIKKDGELVVSGPTENFIYKLGRKLAGRDYSGDYHETSIIQVRKKFESVSEVRMLGTLYPVLPLFEIFSVRF